MWKRWLELKPRRRRLIACVMMLCGLFDLLWVNNPDIVCADSGSVGVAADTLTIKVGYFGGPYYTKRVYTIYELNALPQVQQAYTYIDSMPAVCVDAAEGIKLTDLLTDAGIDVNSIETFYFYATDTQKGWYSSMPGSTLLDSPGYYYPNLPNNWDNDRQLAMPGAEVGAVRVQPIIAARDNWKRFGVAPDFTQMTGEVRFRLLFGQTDTSTANASRSAKWIHAIEVMLGGAPPAGVKLNQNIADSKVGSTFQLTATVHPGKDDGKPTDTRVTWSSSDPKAATVDKNGLVTVVGPGPAAIRVTTVIGNKTDICLVNGYNAGAVNGEHTEPFRAGAPRLNSAPGPASGDLQLLSKKPGIDAGSSAQPARQSWRVYEMSPDASPLQQQPQNNMNAATACITIILFIGGLVKQYKECSREVAK